LLITIETTKYIKMKKTKTIATLFLSLILSACGTTRTTIYKAANFKNSKSSVKTLAILPFNISIEGKRLPKGTTIKTLKEFQEKTGYDMQIKAYTSLMQKQEDYTITFQDIDTTNAFLKMENISFDNIAFRDKAELCKMLGVDGIISGNATMSRPMSDAAAVAVGVATTVGVNVAVNVATLGLFGNSMPGIWGKTYKITTDLTIHDKSGTLLWKCDDKASGTLRNSELVTKGLMDIAAKKFPYTK
jgi:hypothetical protein